MIRRFNRFELKYVLSRKQYLHVLQEVHRFADTDANSTPDGHYRISSLYFDTRDLESYRNKLDGVKYRRKLRLRVYLDGDCSMGMVEVKQRINRTVQKRRLAIPLDDGMRMCLGQPVSLPPDANDLDRALADEVLFLTRAQMLRPKCVISYQREAFVGRSYERGLRITFDSHLKYRAQDLNPAVVARDRYFLRPDLYVMEVKANDKVPHWLTTMVANHQCNLVRLSKYCAGYGQQLEKWSMIPPV